MDPADLLDYALGRLDGPRREQIERQILSDPALAERVARLIRNLERLLDDGLGHSPPKCVPPSSQSSPRSPMPQDSAPRAESENRGDRSPPNSHH